MANISGYDANKYEPPGDFTPLPKGRYTAVATASDWKDTKAGDGRYLQIDWKVVKGEFESRVLFERLNLQNKNPKAVEIANRTLSGICRAVGIMRPKDTVEFHGKPLMITVDVEERKDKRGSFSNRIKKYEAMGAETSAPTETAPAESADDSTPPWMR